jgi:hypothetical protein
MMEHLNYCRKIRREFGDALRVPSVQAQAELANRLRHMVDLIEASQKFCLPPGGVFLMDPELRALDDSEALHLPYPFVALEYSVPDVYPSRRVVLLREVDGYIEGDCIAYLDHKGVWAPDSSFGIPTTNCLDRSRMNSDGGPVVRAYSRPDDETFRHRELLVPLHFLNALSCSNVHVARSDPKKAGKKIKAALPFDTYHVLTIDAPGRAGTGAATGGHRSPREHLRRGHIRRLEDGRRIWVNATVVAAGRGGGVVTKDYAVRCAA